MKGMKYNDAKFTLDNLGNAVRVHARVRKTTIRNSKQIKTARNEKYIQNQGEIAEEDENKDNHENEEEQVQQSRPKREFVLDCVNGKIPEYNSKHDKHLQHFYIRK